MGKLAVLALRGVLVALFAGSLFVQTVMVVLLGRDLDDVPELAYGPGPILVIVVLGILAAQVVLVCVWRLVTMARRGTVFSPASFRYVHVVIGAFVAAALLTFALGVVLAPGEAVAPGIVLLIGGVGLAILGVALVVVVLRMLLAQATQLQAELGEVI